MAAEPDVRVADGFEVERVYTVPKDQQGSWVALAVGEDGRLIASDQGDKGLFRIAPSPIGEGEEGTEVERIDVDISNAQGMLWAFDSLYVNRNGAGSGLWRLRDTTGDGEFDEVEHVLPLEGGGEHGPHAVVLTEDGEGLYVTGGNHTNPPSALTGSRIPTNWYEGHLLPRQWDARGHARGKMAPGGWIARISPDAEQRELVSIGYRNQYDIALNHHGDIFTYDSDMEWDLGMPWYRPTRVNHAVSGSEFGWRSGTGKWPAHYADSLPATANVGPGSPTGVVFGYGADYPAKWQEAFYILDWTYGTIWAAHLEPDGATYTGELEQFVSGSPLPVTDAVVGEDGALYFAVGGRNTDSHLYRVVYRGDESTDAVEPPDASELPEAHQTRRQLESLHHPDAADAVSTAWNHLGSDDRFVRYAARIAIEHQPVERWRDRALREPDPQARITAMVALARQGDSDDLEPALAAMHELDMEALDRTEQLEALRAYQLLFIRLDEPSNAWREKLVDRLEPLFPTGDDALDRDLIDLLVYLDAPGVVEKALPVLKDPQPAPEPDWVTVLGRNEGYGGTFAKWLENRTPLQALHYAFALRNVEYGWTLEQRETYFRFINEAAELPGGASYPGFLENIRKEALENASESERVALADLTGESLEPPPPFEVEAPEGPGRAWNVEEAVAAVEERLEGRDYESGRNLFYATACAACHRFNGEGGSVGPDLSTVANKFSLNDLMEAIVEPSAAISDQYGSSMVTRSDGTTIVGLVGEADDADAIAVYTADPDAPPVTIPREDVESVKESEVSQMPPGLINSLNPDELADLTAYLLSRGDPEAAYFDEP